MTPRELIQTIVDQARGDDRPETILFSAIIRHCEDVGWDRADIAGFLIDTALAYLGRHSTIH